MFTDSGFGKLSDAQAAAVADFIVSLKKESLEKSPRDGIDAATVTVDSPVPFCLHKMWFELHKRENHTLIPRPGAGADELIHAYVLDEIATQYILLLLVDMKSSHMLRLPYRAQEIVPADVAALLPVSQHPNLLAIGNEEETRGRKRPQKRLVAEPG